MGNFIFSIIFYNASVLGKLLPRRTAFPPPAEAPAAAGARLGEELPPRRAVSVPPAAGALLEDASYVRVMETTRALRDRLESRI